MRDGATRGEARSQARQAVILAAGMGTRLGLGPGTGEPLPKPLLELGGRPLLAWVLEALERCGIERVTIVVGWRGETIADFVAKRPIPGVTVELVWNEEWRKSNGVSLLQAKDVIDEPFVLLMSDHVFEDRLLQGLLQEDPRPDEIVLAVDRRLGEVFDMDDATKVRTNGARHGVAIGKALAVFDAVDTGVFLCQPCVFEALEAARVDGDCSISAGMQALADERRLRVHDIGDAFWQDVDDPAMYGHAEQNLWRLASPSRFRPDRAGRGAPAAPGVARGAAR